MKILVIRLSSLGDVLLTTPMLSTLHRLYPDVEIDFVIFSQYAGLLDNNPLVQRVLPISRGWNFGGQLASYIHNKYDLVFDLQGKIKSFLISHIVSSPSRYTYKKRNWRQLFKSIQQEKPIICFPHAAYDYHKVIPVEQISVSMEVTYRLKKSEKEWAAKWFNKQVKRQEDKTGLAAKSGGKNRGDNETAGADSKRSEKVVALCMGGLHPVKKWSFDNWRQLIELLSQKGGIKILLVGGSESAAEAAKLTSDWPGIVIGDTCNLGIREMGALLARCRVAVGHDTGAIHLAAALGLKVISLFGPTPICRWAPLTAKRKIISTNFTCSPCSNYGEIPCKYPNFHLTPGSLEAPCMAAIDSKKIYDYIINFLN